MFGAVGVEQLGLGSIRRPSLPTQWGSIRVESQSSSPHTRNGTTAHSTSPTASPLRSPHVSSLARRGRRARLPPCRRPWRSSGTAGPPRRSSDGPWRVPVADPLVVDPAVAPGSPGRRIGGVGRVGKLLLVDTDGPTLGMHFGMTGRLVVDGMAVVERLAYGSLTDDDVWDRSS